MKVEISGAVVGKNGHWHSQQTLRAFGAQRGSFVRSLIEMHVEPLLDSLVISPRSLQPRDRLRPACKGFFKLSYQIGS